MNLLDLRFWKRHNFLHVTVLALLSAPLPTASLLGTFRIYSRGVGVFRESPCSLLSVSQLEQLLHSTVQAVSHLGISWHFATCSDFSPKCEKACTQQRPYLRTRKWSVPVGGTMKNKGTTVLPNAIHLNVAGKCGLCHWLAPLIVLKCGCVHEAQCNHGCSMHLKQVTCTEWLAANQHASISQHACPAAVCTFNMKNMCWL